MTPKFYPLTLRFEFMGSPGNSGSSKLSLSAAADGSIKLTDEVVDETDIRAGTVSAASGWRGVVSYLAQHEACAFFTDGSMEGEYPWPANMKLKGSENFATDLIACAWAGEPLVDIALALSRQSDEVLAALRQKHGSLRDEDFLEALLRIKRWADELGADFGDTISRGHRFGFDFRAMRRDVVQMARVIEAESAAAKLRHEWNLSPYQAGIEALVAAWRSAHPATSTNSAMGRGMQSGALRAFLEAYVTEHGCLPLGRHQVPATRQLQAFEVNL